MWCVVVCCGVVWCCVVLYCVVWRGMLWCVVFHVSCVQEGRINIMRLFRVLRAGTSRRCFLEKRSGAGFSFSRRTFGPCTVPRRFRATGLTTGFLKAKIVFLLNLWSPLCCLIYSVNSTTPPCTLDPCHGGQVKVRPGVSEYFRIKSPKFNRFRVCR